MQYKVAEYYNSLKTYQKVELYLLPVFLFGYLLYLYLTLAPQTQVQNNSDIITPSHSQPQINSKELTNQNLEIIKKIDTKARRYSFNIHSFDIIDGKVQINSLGGFKGMMNFIYEVDKDYTIESLSMNLGENLRSISLQITLLPFQNQQNFNYKELLRELDKISSPFKEKNIATNQRLHFQIKAILEDSVLIDKEFVKVGNIYKGYKLIKIESSGAVFSFNDEIIKVKF